MKYDVIIDCYTDEPSGLGVPPYLGVHSRYIAGALKNKNVNYYYLNIDDLRFANGEQQKPFLSTIASGTMVAVIALSINTLAKIFSIS